jgi:predicted nuclease with TOPRIM domain
MKINQELSLFIPHVFTNFTEDYIKDFFGIYGDIDHVDFVSKIDRYGKSYNSVYIHFYAWYNTKEVEEFQQRIEDPDNPPRIYHDAPWFWNVLKNNAKKHVPGERKERINVKETAAAVRPCAEKEFYERDDDDCVPDLISAKSRSIFGIDFDGGETLMEFALRSELKKLKKEVEQLNALVEESQDNAKKQLEDNVKLYGEVERLTFEKEELQQLADRNSSQLETAERSVARLQNLSKHYFELLDEKDDLKEDNDNLKEDNDNLKEDNDRLTEDNYRLEEYNYRLEQEKVDLKASVAALHEEQELMQMLVEDLSNQIKANRSQDTQDSLQYFVAQREDMIDSMVDAIQNSVDLQTAKEAVDSIYQNPEYYPVASYLRDEPQDDDHSDYEYYDSN